MTDTNGDLNILPPDEKIFHEKKSRITEKQRLHLAKAREKARETTLRRKQLDLENQKKKKEDENIVLEKKEESDDDDDDEDVLPPPPVKPKKEPKTRKTKKDMSDEEKEIHRFEKFMTNMKYYEELKIQNEREKEESKKIKMSFTQDEYDDILKVLNEAEKKAEIEKQSPVVAPKAVAPQPKKINLISNHNLKSHNRSRFGSG